MNSADIREIFRRLAELRPDPKSELNYRTPFELLVAVVLSAQATDKSVNEATKVLYAHANTPDSDGSWPLVTAIPVHGMIY